MKTAICTCCDAPIEEAGAKFCTICGSALPAEQTMQRRKETMIYKAIPLNENGKAIVCPYCENEELTQGDFCKICGNDIINRCADMQDPDGKNITVRSCGKILQGNARYCSFCGNESAFYKKGWLKDWKSENTKKAIRNVNNPDNAIKFKEIKEEKAK